MNQTIITGSMLHDLVRCDHRVALDVHGDHSLRAEANEFVEMLWEGGMEHEAHIIARLLADAPGAIDLRSAHPSVRGLLTLRAMEEEAPLIVGGEISAEDLLGGPDLLRIDGDGYIAGDIKLGAGEDQTPGVPRLRYAVQVALYCDILDRNDLLSRSYGFIIDGRGEELFFPLDASMGGTKGTLLDEYEAALECAREIVNEVGVVTRSMHAAECKLCRWYPVCKADESPVTTSPGSRNSAARSAMAL